MLRPHARLILAFPFFWVTSFGALCAEEETGMAKAKVEMGKLFPVAIEGERLMLSRLKWSVTDEEREKASPLDHVEKLMLEQTGQRYSPPHPFQERCFYVVRSIGREKSETSSSSGDPNSGCRWEVKREAVSASGFINTSLDRYSLRLEEHKGARHLLIWEDDRETGMMFRLIERAAARSLHFIQTPKGHVSLFVVEGDKQFSLSANSFADLLRKHPAETQVKFLRPLAEIGIAPPLHPLLPPVMAAATTGFSEGAAEHLSQADALIAKLADEDAAVRDEATGALIKLYPFAVSHVRSAEAKTEDAESKMRLKKVIAAHPTIEKALEFVKEKRLHEDKAYLLDLLANVPFFRKSAHARLAALYGKDYGEDASKWPKP